MPIICKHETFAPILYVFEHSTISTRRSACTERRRRRASPRARSSLDSYPQRRALPGLHRQRLRHRQRQHRHVSGAEIGGAFGGEKETGGGREAGSDSWKILHAPPDLHDQLGHRAPARPGRRIQRLSEASSPLEAKPPCQRRGGFLLDGLIARAEPCLVLMYTWRTDKESSTLRDKALWSDE